MLKVDRVLMYNQKDCYVTDYPWQCLAKNVTYNKYGSTLCNGKSAKQDNIRDNSVMCLELCKSLQRICQSSNVSHFQHLDKYITNFYSSTRVSLLLLQPHIRGEKQHFPALYTYQETWAVTHTPCLARFNYLSSCALAWHSQPPR